MRSGDRTRRRVIGGLVAAVLVSVVPQAGGGGESTTGPGAAAAPRDREARRRWALARMDEMARERLRCHERFRAAEEVRGCQAEFERRHRAYNEVYIEATRD
jgi:hypothetical protein